MRNTALFAILVIELALVPFAPLIGVAIAIWQWHP